MRRMRESLLRTALKNGAELIENKVISGCFNAKNRIVTFKNCVIEEASFHKLGVFIFEDCIIKEFPKRLDDSDLAILAYTGNTKFEKEFNHLTESCLVCDKAFFYNNRELADNVDVLGFVNTKIDEQLVCDIDRKIGFAVNVDFEVNTSGLFEEEPKIIKSRFNKDIKTVYFKNCKMEEVDFNGKVEDVVIRGYEEDLANINFKSKVKDMVILSEDIENLFFEEEVSGLNLEFDIARNIHFKKKAEIEKLEIEHMYEMIGEIHVKELIVERFVNCNMTIEVVNSFLDSNIRDSEMVLIPEKEEMFFKGELNNVIFTVAKEASFCLSYKDYSENGFILKNTKLKKLGLLNLSDSNEKEKMIVLENSIIKDTNKIPNDVEIRFILRKNSLLNMNVESMMYFSLETDKTSEIRVSSESQTEHNRMGVGALSNVNLKYENKSTSEVKLIKINSGLNIDTGNTLLLSGSRGMLFNSRILGKLKVAKDQELILRGEIYIDELEIDQGELLMNTGKIFLKKVTIDGITKENVKLEDDTIIKNKAITFHN